MNRKSWLAPLVDKEARPQRRRFAVLSPWRCPYRERRNRGYRRSNCGTMLTSKVTPSSYAGRPVVLKTYPAADTARFKCWGSGSRNEAIARRRLGTIVPELVHWAFDDHAEFAWLEWIDGDSPRGTDELCVAAGRTLGRVHTQAGPYWGSLDGVWRFRTCRDALRSRFAAGVNLLAIAGLAARVRGGAGAALDRLTVHRAPALVVHGDLGLGNLLLDQGVRVLDWEHARWGDLHEDWARYGSPRCSRSRTTAVTPAPSLWWSMAGARSWAGALPATRRWNDLSRPTCAAASASSSTVRTTHGYGVFATSSARTLRYRTSAVRPSQALAPAAHLRRRPLRRLPHHQGRAPRQR
jgi:hypothetical protein